MFNDKDPSRWVRSLECLPQDLKAKFKKILLPHKFDHERYVSKNAIIKNNENEATKNSWKHRLWAFNDAYYKEKIQIEQKKDYSIKFNQQYAQILQTNEEKPGSITNHYWEIFKKRGYNVSNIDTKENVFIHSVWIDVENNYPNILPTITPRYLKHDVQYLANWEKNMKKKINANYTIKESQEDNNQSNSGNIGQEIPRLLSPSQYKKENRKIKKEIKVIKNTIRNEEQENENYASISTKEDFGYLTVSSKKKPTEKKIKSDGVFLSSKGMLRSAKKTRNKRVKCCVLEWNNGKRDMNINKVRHKPWKSEAKENSNVNKRRWEIWKEKFNDIKQSDFISKEATIKNYLKTFQKEMNLNQRYINI